MGPKRCVSTCKQFSKEECNPPRCAYVNGNTRRYCRLSSKYVMRKPSCSVTRKIKKGEKEGHARKQISDFLGRTGKVVQIVCSKSGECLSFGKKTNEITSLFKGFTGFEYAISPIKKLGAPSVNGFVKEIEYERNGYKAYAALKSCQNATSDNLVYEYLVGIKYINRVMKQFPCFLQTYGLYFYKEDINRVRMSSAMPLNKALLNELVLQNTIDYKKACKDSLLASILIQHIHSAITVKSIVRSHNPVLEYDLIYVFFIIYQTLNSLKTKFTHYDLHDENVLLFEPSPGKHIQYKYHLLDGTIIEFRCPFIPKIIDYGRSFFDNGNVNSKTVYNKLCKECNNCGERVGFGWLDPKPYFGISSQKKNESHDLRFLDMVRQRLDAIPSGKSKIFIELKKMLGKIIYGKGIRAKEEKLFGTSENLKLHPNGKYIANVTDAYEYLKKLISDPEIVKLNNTKYQDPNKYGIFHIYESGRGMEYIAV